MKIRETNVNLFLNTTFRNLSSLMFPLLSVTHTTALCRTEKVYLSPSSRISLGFLSNNFAGPKFCRYVDGSWISLVAPRSNSIYLSWLYFHAGTIQYLVLFWVFAILTHVMLFERNTSPYLMRLQLWAACSFHDNIITELWTNPLHEQFITHLSNEFTN